MPRYTIDVKDFLLFEEQAKAMYDRTTTRAEAFVVSSLWIAGPRPQELLMMHPEAVQIGMDGVALAVPTLKRGTKSGSFQVTTRLLGFKRPAGMDTNPYLESIIDFAQRAQPGAPMLDYSTRWMEKLINRLGTETIGKKIAPYHLRHSVFTWLARNGWDAYAIKYWKGAATLASVEEYIRAKPQVIEFENLHRNLHQPRMAQVLPVTAYQPSIQVAPILELQQFGATPRAEFPRAPENLPQQSSEPSAAKLRTLADLKEPEQAGAAQPLAPPAPMRTLQEVEAELQALKLAQKKSEEKGAEASTQA